MELNKHVNTTVFCKKLTRYEGNKMKYPKKHVKEFCHGMAFAFLFEMPKSKDFIFGSFSVFKLVTCFLFEMSHLYYAAFESENWKNGPFLIFRA